MDQEPKDVRLPVMVGRSDLEAIDAWRYSNHVPTRAEAIRRLIELGLKAMPEPASVKDLVDHYRRVGRPDLADVVELGLKDMKS